MNEQPQSLPAKDQIYQAGSYQTAEVEVGAEGYFRQLLQMRILPEIPYQQTAVPEDIEQELEEDLDKEQVRAQAHIINPALWVLDNEFINENQEPFEFDSHRFMLQPYSDSHPEQVIMKSAQVGWSVLAILKSVHAAKYLRMNIIYVLPTRNASAEFVVPKVNPMLQRNPVLAKLLKNTDNKHLKAVGDRWIYFKGAFHQGEAISTSADLIVSDEHDRSDQAVLSTYQSRLQASRYGWFWKFSNPSIPSFGVHELFQISDQMHWFVTCPHCGYEMYMDFERESIELGDKEYHTHYVRIINKEKYHEEAIYACGSCHQELQDDDRQAGRWIPKFPDRPVRGYWICQMMVPWVSATKIIRQMNTMSIEDFYNFVLGKPYQASEFLINRDAILNARNFGTPDRSEVYLGVDVGKEKHWVLGDNYGIITYGKCTSWEEIEDLINLYEATTVIDALPDFTVPEQLSRKYPGQVFVNYFVHDTKNMDAIKKKEGEEFGVLQSDRTKIFDILAAEITSKRLCFYQTAEALNDLIGHFENIYRVVELDTKQIARAKWETKGEGENNKRPDHYAFATLYYRIARAMGVGPDDAGGIRMVSPAQKTSGYQVVNDTVKVSDALGMDLDVLVEKSLKRNKMRRV